MTPKVTAYPNINWMIVDNLWIERDHFRDSPYYTLHPYFKGRQVLEELGMVGQVSYERWSRNAVMDDFGNLRLVNLFQGESQWEYSEEL